MLSSAELCMNKIISTERKYKKVPNRSHGAEKCSRGVQQHTRWDRRKVSKSKDWINSIVLSEQQKEKEWKKSEDGLKNLWDNIKQTNIYIIGVPEGGERENLLEGKKGWKVP